VRKQWNTISILGVGLIGGSIGAAICQRKIAKKVVGIGRSAARLRQAKKIGAVTSTTTQLERGVAEADLVIVCTPSDQVAEHVLRVSQVCAPNTLITDAGSVKGKIVSQVERTIGSKACFIGSHPLAGSEKTGCQYSDADLLVDRVVVVTPMRRTDQRQLAEIEKFWHLLGAQVIQMTPAAHDRTLATTSHLPHVVASALAAATPAHDLPCTATGWRDTTRIAAGDAELWRQILLGNRSHVLKSLDRFEKVLNSIRQAIEQDHGGQLRKTLATGKKIRDLVAD